MSLLQAFRFDNVNTSPDKEMASRQVWALGRQFAISGSETLS